MQFGAEGFRNHLSKGFAKPLGKDLCKASRDFMNHPSKGFTEHLS